MRRGATIGLVAALMLCLVTASAAADARTDFLVRMLTTSTQFRVRLQAALALGSQEAEPKIVAALAKALQDANASVRSASASSLARLGDTSAVPALQRAKADRDPDVRREVEKALATLSPSQRGRSPGGDRAPPAEPSEPSGPASFYVGVGVPGDKVGLSDAELSRLRDHLVEAVQEIDGVLIAPQHESESAARKVMGKRKLSGFYIDGSVTKVEVRSDGAVRAEVSVIVGSYPDRSIRAMLSGAATLPGGGSSPIARERAIQGAFSGALRRLPQAMHTSSLAQGR